MSGKKKIIISLLIALAIILIAVYISGVFYYKDKFPNNVSINGVDVGGRTNAIRRTETQNG